MTEQSIKSSSLTREERRQVEQSIAQFELAWHQSPCPDPLAFLPSLQSIRSVTMDELLRIDAEFKSHRHDNNTSEPSLASPTSTHLKAITVASIYSHMKPHAEGGLGEILIADDEQLARRVVVKRLKECWVTNRRAVQSFMMEAQIASRLEHPGIVPIHARGTTDDGLPWYSMRFVEGTTLGQEIKQLHLDWNDVSRRGSVLRSLLTSLVAACKTVAYAHSRGIMHRDLKPDNIMLGPFGETLVMDWGMAKLMTDTVDPLEFHGVEYPQGASGVLVGTPAYMSPEQAYGDLSKLTPQTDVFGLGTILYSMLYNRAPFQSDSAAESVRKATQNVSQPQIESTTEVPVGLNAICCRAMAELPQDRYASPLQLATDIESWLADEPILAMRETLWDRTRRKSRQHRSAVAVLAAIGFILPVVAIIGSWFLAQQRLQTEIAERKAAIRGESIKEVTQYLTKVLRSVDPMPFEDPGFVGPEPNSSDAIMQRMLDAGSELLADYDADQPELRCQLLIAFGTAYRALADYDKAALILTECYQVRLKVFGARSAETLESQYHLARVAHDRGDYQAAERQYRDVIVKLEKVTPTIPLKVADVKSQLALLLFWQPLGIDLPQFNRSAVNESVQLYSEVVEIRRQLLPPNDRSIGIALAGLAAAQAVLPDQQLAAAANSLAALEIFRDSKQERTLGNYLIEYYKAERFREQDRWQEADEIYLKLLAQSLRAMGKNHPAVIIHQWNMVGMYRKMGSLKRAEEVIFEIREALKYCVAIRSSPIVVDSLMQYADALQDIDVDRSREVFLEAIRYANERSDSNRGIILQMQEKLEALPAVSTTDPQREPPIAF